MFGVRQLGVILEQILQSFPPGKLMTIKANIGGAVVEGLRE